MDHQPAQPKKPVSFAQVESLAAKGATEEEMADYLGISPKTLSRRFGRVIKKMRALLRISLRHKQIELATKDNGDLRMLQWLGQYYLNQNDESQEPPPSMPVKGYIGIDPDQI